MKNDENMTIKKILGKFYSRHVCRHEINFTENKYDFVFHMTDWIDDLYELADLYKKPENKSYDEIHSAVYGFLSHAMSHIHAAAKLIDIKPVRFDIKKVKCDLPDHPACGKEYYRKHVKKPKTKAKAARGKNK
jgi:hypothetical protein